MKKIFDEDDDDFQNFDKAKIKELVEKHPNDTQLKQLYDEIENGWAVDEDNAFNVYQKLAGEAEARNVQARLETNGKEYPLKTILYFFKSTFL